MSRKAYLTLHLWLLCTLVAEAQINLTGQVLELSSGNIVPFVQVSITAIGDSNTTKATVSDLSGRYLLNNIRPGMYLLRAASSPYEEYCDTVRLRMPSGSNTITKDITLVASSYSMQEVTVKGNRAVSHAGHISYTFSDKQIKTARQALDLMSFVEDLRLNVQSGKLERMNGGAVKVLLNGANATSNELKSIPPSKIRRVDYYDIPPAKYGTGVTVVNVITKSLDNGMGAGADITSAVSTGFINGSAYLNMKHGKSQFTADYSVGFRNYRDRQIASTQLYRLFSGDETMLSYKKDHFGYCEQYASLKYNYSDEDKTMFQLKLSPFHETRFSTGSGSLTINSAEKKEISDDNSRSSGFVVDTYFSKKKRSGNEFAANLVGTYHNSRQTMTWQEFAGENLSMQDDMLQRADKLSIAGEANYTWHYPAGNLTVGMKSLSAWASAPLSSIMTGYEEQKTKSSSFENFCYGEYSGSKGAYMFKVGGRMGAVVLKSGGNTFGKFMVLPTVVVARNLKHGIRIQYSLQTESTIPSLSDISEGAAMLNSRLVRKGAANLKSGYNLYNLLSFTKRGKYIDITLAALSDYDSAPIHTSFAQTRIKSREYIMAISQNFVYGWQYGGFYQVGLKLFGETLQFRVYGLLLKQIAKEDKERSYDNFYSPVFFDIQYKKPSWGISYTTAIKSSSLDGMVLSRDENQSHLQAYYQTGGWRFGVGCMWMFTKSKYCDEILNNPIYGKISTTEIADNKSMITVSVSFNFSKGKKHTFSQKITNSDTDNGLFKK